MPRNKFKYTKTYRITKNELRKYGSFNFPDLMMDSIIDDSLMQVSEGIIAFGEGGLDLLTGMLIELKQRNAITLNDDGKSIIPNKYL